VIARADWVDQHLAKEYELTSRQTDILTGIAKGMTYPEIGAALFLSRETVHTHAKALYRKLGVNGGSAAVAVAYDFGLLRTRAVRVERAKAAGLRVVA
jgi:DNA-binding NarL/FixJ family response regulator